MNPLPSVAAEAPCQPGGFLAGARAAPAGPPAPFGTGTHGASLGRQQEPRSLSEMQQGPGLDPSGLNRNSAEEDGAWNNVGLAGESRSENRRSSGWQLA